MHAASGCSLGRAGQIIRGCSRFGGWTWWCVPGGIWGRSGLILLSVQAGRLRTHRKVLLLAAGRWGPLAYPAGVEPAGERAVAAAPSRGAGGLGERAA